LIENRCRRGQERAAPQPRRLDFIRGNPGKLPPLIVVAIAIVVVIVVAVLYLFSEQPQVQGGVPDLISETRKPLFHP
jgi:hypothetical protein